MNVINTYCNGVAAYVVHVYRSGTNRHHEEQPATIISVQYSHVDDPKCPDSITRTYRCTATAVPSLSCRRVARASQLTCVLQPSFTAGRTERLGWRDESIELAPRLRTASRHRQNPKQLSRGHAWRRVERRAPPRGTYGRQEAAGAALLLPTLPPACDDDVVVYSRR